MGGLTVVMCERGGPHLVSVTRGGCPCGYFTVRRVDGTEGPLEEGDVPSFADFAESFSSVEFVGSERWPS